jgi:hypothetical protein
VTIEDQPRPEPNERPHITDLVVADLVERKRIGTERYGTPLQPFNGRDALVDAYQEVLDLANYVRQRIWEDEHRETRGKPEITVRQFAYFFAGLPYHRQLAFLTEWAERNKYDLTRKADG